MTWPTAWERESTSPWDNEDELNRWLLADTGLTLEQLREAPSGYQYAQPEYQKYLKQGERPFRTPSGRVEFTSEYLKRVWVFRASGLCPSQDQHA